MNNSNTAVGIYKTHEAAEAAIRELEKSGFDMKQLSIVGKNYHSDEHVIGYYNTGDRMKAWGERGAFWGSLWGMLFGSAFFVIPGLGPVLMAGPVVALILSTLEGAAVGGGISVLAAALASIGIPENSIVNYEAELKIGKFLLIAHGTPEEVERAKDLLDDKTATAVSLHNEESHVSV